MPHILENRLLSKVAYNLVLNPVLNVEPGSESGSESGSGAFNKLEIENMCHRNVPPPSK